MIEGVLAIFAELLHLGTAGRYGYFRDELYFIACSKHMAWGYVDQPPLVAAAAFLASPTGYELTALRILPIVAAALTVFLAVAMTHELGGGRFAQILTGVATMLAPAYLLLGNTLTTTSFEPLTWTLVVYACIRIVSNIVRQDAKHAQQWWMALAGAVVLGGYSKYSIALLIVGLAVGLMVTRERRILFSAWPVIATLVAILALLPNLLWQAGHGWPIFEVLREDAAHRPAFQNGVALEYLNLWTNARAFALEQLLYLNPVSAPVWLAGIVAPFAIGRMRDLRFVSVAYLVVFAIAAALGAKGYYIVGIYATLFAFGAIAIERVAAVLRYALLGAVIAVGILAMPLSLSILPVNTLVWYSQRLGLTGQNGTPAHLVQPVFAEEFGWGRLAHDVAVAYFKLPTEVRRRTAIYADTYGDAGALDFFGPKYGLPLAISSQNNYYLWGTHGYDGSTLIAVGASRVDLLRKYYRSVTLVATSTEPYRWVVEGPAPIYLCRDPVAPLSEIWPHLRWYGA
ncbi:MAG TPA: glycosyltransferase family 39 protein [Candidatus Baltobacteraceae bacterium]|nr:glycosyltransferase family 39 protein [Candidatus Baltobacteraceae bacterium]